MLVFYCFCICKILRRRRRRRELHTLLTTHYPKFQSFSCRCMHASQTHIHAISVALHFAVDIQPTMTAPCSRSEVVFVFAALECEAFLSISPSQNDKLPAADAHNLIYFVRLQLPIYFFLRPSLPASAGAEFSVGCSFFVCFLVCVFVLKFIHLKLIAELKWLFRTNFVNTSGSITQNAKIDVFGKRATDRAMFFGEANANRIRIPKTID